mmetsp:Transcript_18546/g.35255  ORF Transcript_18546/g.35255 Transcript_18546/m.35255 type:complete len:95 (+) Transcript_18546:1634-1918(+)
MMLEAKGLVPPMSSSSISISLSFSSLVTTVRVRVEVDEKRGRCPSIRRRVGWGTVNPGTSVQQQQLVINKRIQVHKRDGLIFLFFVVSIFCIRM